MFNHITIEIKSKKLVFSKINRYLYDYRHNFFKMH